MILGINMVDILIQWNLSLLLRYFPNMVLHVLKFQAPEMVFLGME